MPRFDLQIPASDGVSNGTLHVPGGQGPWPGALVFTDIFGPRDTFLGVAVPGDPSSPHLAAGQVRAAVLVAGSIDDAGFTAEHAALLGDALTAAGVPHTVETWPGHHGFAVPDQQVYDEALAERHWGALRDRYAQRLG